MALLQRFGFLILTMFLAWTMFNQASQMVAAFSLQASSSMIQATLTDKSVRRAGDISDVYTFSYTYTIDGKDYTDRSIVDADRFNDYAIGENIPIYYENNHPQNTRALTSALDMPNLIYDAVMFLIELVLTIGLAYLTFHLFFPGQTKTTD